MGGSLFIPFNFAITTQFIQINFITTKLQIQYPEWRNRHSQVPTPIYNIKQSDRIGAKANWTVEGVVSTVLYLNQWGSNIVSFHFKGHVVLYLAAASPLQHCAHQTATMPFLLFVSVASFPLRFENHPLGFRNALARENFKI